MNDVISPYDLGSFQTVENSQKINIDELVRNAQKMLKKRLVEAQIDALGVSIELTTSKTRFNGERIWFICPICQKRAGTILRKEDKIGCRKCLNLTYTKQRFKNMVELRS